MNPFFLILFAGYAACLALYFLGLESSGKPYLAWAKRTALFFLFFHALLLADLYFAGITEDLYVISFLLLATAYFLEWRRRVNFLMLFSLPIALALCLLALVLTPKEAVTPMEPPSWLWVHLGLIFSGMAGLILAAAAALMYLLQSFQLKSKHLGRVFLRLPSLDALDRVHFVSLSWGAVLFSLGVLVGFFGAGRRFEWGQLLSDPRVVLSSLTCILYWGVLSLRARALRRGQKVAVGTVLVFIVLFAALLSSYFAPSSFHRGI